MADEMAKCVHPGCNCPKAEDSDYCSAYCKDAGDLAEIECSCGHDGCSLAA